MYIGTYQLRQPEGISDKNVQFAKHHFYSAKKQAGRNIIQAPKAGRSEGERVGG